MSVIEDSAPPAEDPDLPEDVDGPTDGAEAPAGEAPWAGGAPVLALGEDPEDPPGATRRMIIALAIVIVVVAAVAALTVVGVSKQHRPSVAAAHGHVASSRGTQILMTTPTTLFDHR